MALDLVLPPDLAPPLRQEVLRLVAECGLAGDRPHVSGRRPTVPANRCHVCHRGGRMGGHHVAAGEVVFIHRSCHRRLHRVA